MPSLRPSSAPGACESTRHCRNARSRSPLAATSERLSAPPSATSERWRPTSESWRHCRNLVPLATSERWPRGGPEGGPGEVAPRGGALPTSERWRRGGAPRGGPRGRWPRREVGPVPATSSSARNLREVAQVAQVAMSDRSHQRLKGGRAERVATGGSKTARCRTGARAPSRLFRLPGTAARLPSRFRMRRRDRNAVPFSESWIWTLQKRIFVSSGSIWR